MRPSIVNYLNEQFSVKFFNSVIPTSLHIYLFIFIIISILLFRRFKKLNHNKSDIVLFIGLCSISALVGAKTAFILLHVKSYIQAPSHIFQSGSISWGAYVGLFIFVIVYTKFRKTSTLPYLDIIASFIPIGIFFGRWGCFLNGCDFGAVSTLPWAVQYPFNSIPFGMHYEMGIIKPTASFSARVHPNQLYLSLNGLLLFLLLRKIWFKYRQVPGLTFTAFLILYGITRFFVEFFRFYSAESYFIHLNPSQWLALACTFIGILLFGNKHFKLINQIIVDNINVK